VKFWCLESVIYQCGGETLGPVVKHSVRRDIISG